MLSIDEIKYRLDSETNKEELLNVFIEMEAKIKRYEKIIHAIANVDTMFMNGDGSEREWDDKEALKEIDNLVTPVWEEHCKSFMLKYDNM